MLDFAYELLDAIGGIRRFLLLNFSERGLVFLI